MSSSQVGFSLQGDIVSGGSILFNASGRLLKAMSDGGVDIYAVSAAVWLGRTMPIKTQHESSIHSLLASRGSRSSFLVKALSIGWGHSEIAVELARTRAGTAALLNIGAMATGFTHYAAAEGLTELLLLSGCENDRIPNVDALKMLVAYVAPLMVETGFPKVFSHIASTAQQYLKAKPLGALCTGLLEAGEAQIWAGTVRQLILTAQRDERLYLLVRQRGAWLVAYASHVLGMAVEMFILDEIVWECAGTHGSVVFLFDLGISKCPQIHNGSKLEIVNHPTNPDGCQRMRTTHLLKEALGIEIPSGSDEFETHERIAWLALALKESLLLSSRRDSVHPLNGKSPGSLSALRQVLSDLGLSSSAIDSGTSRSHNVAFEAVGEPEAEFIYGFASTSVALMQCKYDADKLRVDSDTISGRRPSSWMSRFWMTQTTKPLSLTEMASCLSEANLKHNDIVWMHLSEVLHGPDTPGDIIREPRLFPVCELAVSAADTTIYYRAIMDEDCFDAQDRLFAIQSGRVSLNKVLRHFVYENHDSLDRPLLGSVAEISPGFPIEPHYAGGDVEVVMDAVLSEDGIRIHTMVFQQWNGNLTCNISLTGCIKRLLRAVNKLTCSHSTEASLSLPGRDPICFATFGFSPAFRFRKGIIIYPLRGNRLKQLIQCGILSEECWVILQSNCCLNCAVDACKSQNLTARNPVIIMAN